MDCSLPGSSIHGILQARIWEWVAISFSRGSSWPRDWIQVSRIASRFFIIWLHMYILHLSELVFHLFTHADTFIHTRTYTHLPPHPTIHLITWKIDNDPLAAYSPGSSSRVIFLKWESYHVTFLFKIPPWLSRFSWDKQAALHTAYKHAHGPPQVSWTHRPCTVLPAASLGLLKFLDFKIFPQYSILMHICGI